MVKAFRCVHAAGALRLWDIVHFVRRLGAYDGLESESPATSYEGAIGKPWLTIERLEPCGLPPPNPVTDDRGDVIGNVHRLAGTCPGSGSGSDLGTAG